MQRAANRNDSRVGELKVAGRKFERSQRIEAACGIKSQATEIRRPNHERLALKDIRSDEHRVGAYRKGWPPNDLVARDAKQGDWVGVHWSDRNGPQWGTASQDDKAQRS